MSYTRTLVVLVTLVLASSFLAASGESAWFPLADSQPGASASVSRRIWSEEHLSLRVRIPGLAAWDVQSKGGSYSRIALPGGGHFGQPGEPGLPALRYLVEVPPGGALKVELSPSSLQTYSLDQLGLHAPLLPVQPPVEKIPGAEDLAVFVKDAKLYAQDGFFPAERVRVEDRAVLRGRHVALIEVRPVRYNPQRGEIEVWSSAELSVFLEGGRSELARREKARLESAALTPWLDREIFSSLPSASTAAPESKGEAGGASEGAEGMLVIVNDAFTAALQPLVDWKRKSGYKVDVVETSTLGSSPSDEDVKAAIQQRYDTWSNPSLGFVLMVGDTDFTPIHQGNGGGKSQVTDNWFACVDGSDYLPDLAIARISSRSTQETSDVVGKLLTYEKASFAASAWIKDASFIGTSDSGHIDQIENTHDYCIDTYYTPNGYRQTPWSYGHPSSDRHYNSTDADTADISDSINAGRSMVNYSGHGGYTSWEGPTSHASYDQADINANTNDGLYPFVISNACITGTLDREECFGETWQRAPNKGAIAFWGASNNSYWDEDDVLQRNLHDNIFPMDSTPPLGILVNETKLDLYDHYGDVGNVAYYFDMYNLLSEPSLSLWTREARAWDVSYPETHPIGESSFVVDVSFGGQPVEGALVAVRKADEGVFESGYTDASGGVTLILDPAPENVGVMEVTATAHDFLPHEGSSEVISPDGPWLVHRSHGVDDSTGGDGDGQANPGESFVMPVTVENVGEQSGTGLAATVTTSTPDWCEMLDSSASFPDLAPGESGSSLPDHYQVRVKPDAPDGVQLGFDLAWTASDGSSGTTSFKEQVTAVDFDLDSYSIDDADGGNGNGVAGPGETVDMTLTLANVGHKGASGISGVLTSDSPHITILTDSANYPDLAAGAKGDSEPPPYRFSVAEDAPDQQSVTFMLTVDEAGSSYGEVLVFDVMISSCSQTDSLDVPKAISDNTTSESLLSFPHAVEIGEVNVHVDIAHSYTGDLTVQLVSPSGTTCLLHDRSGGSNDDIRTWYDTETAPAEPLSVFNGENAFGDWKLIVTDHAGGDEGSIDGWTLEVCGDGIPPVATLSLTGFRVDDATACDPDGVADVGETVIYQVTIENTGWGSASGVSASLSSTSAVAVLNNPVGLPDLDIGASAQADFQVLIGAVGCREQADFTLAMNANEGSWEDGFVDTLEADINASSETEDLEHAGVEPTGWTHDAAEGVDDWHLVSDKNHTAGGVYSWFVSDVDSRKDDRLVSRAYTLYGGSTLEFWHSIDSESGYDGGVLEISEDDGGSWTDLGPYLTTGAYDRSLSGTSAISGQDAWTGSYEEWRQVVADLSTFAGKTVRFRWRFVCDTSSGRTGWWVDDIIVDSNEEVCDGHACGIPGEMRVTGVSRDGADVLLEWWADPLCLEFRVWRSADASSQSSFADVSAEDPDPSDTQFRDSSSGSLLYWIIQGVGPDGDGPWGHYGM